MKPLIILAIETAMRRGEMLELQWQHVDLVRCVAHLPLTKNGDTRDIPLSRRAVATLQELKADKDRDGQRVFRSRATQSALRSSICAFVLR